MIEDEERMQEITLKVTSWVVELERGLGDATADISISQSLTECCTVVKKKEIAKEGG